MLKEIKNVRQIEGEPTRRWFSDPALDLFVWYGDADDIIKFQLCYGKGANEHALTWSRSSGYSHHGVDDGEGGIYEMKCTPILVPDGAVDIENVCGLFSGLGRKIDHDIFEFVITHIKAYQQT
ncbi:MAG: hypothetical protein A2W28_02550 [Gammaproteobacteria bacterium RBG_16_51_14]|nr:MAG: hypothetical protein A2W28_02550 [Gammaproteobacteria bacterium RBG_16_51_14]